MINDSNGTISTSTTINQRKSGQNIDGGGGGLMFILSGKSINRLNRLYRPSLFVQFFLFFHFSQKAMVLIMNIRKKVNLQSIHLLVNYF